jgi:ABC transport system ATP-binding/permease protein
MIQENGYLAVGEIMAVLLSVQDVAKSFGHVPLFAGLSLEVTDDQRLGLIGPNGSGKSTLLKVLFGSEPPDEGLRTLRRGTRLGYLAQDDAFDAEVTAADVLRAALEESRLEEHDRDTRVAICLTRCGFTDPGVTASTLSGGWRKRLALARELVRQPDLLLLDEPTNHLDLPGILWLERLLREAEFGYIVATHDRAFLRAVADEILEVSRVYPEGCFRSAGSYDEFVERREQFLEAQERRQQAVANQVRRETEWLSRKAAARTRKAASRIQEAQTRREGLADMARRTAATRAAGIDFVETGRQTRKLLWTEGVSKSLGGRKLFDNINLLLSPGTKVGLVGPNGCGKSTLLRLLHGELAPDAGSIQRADGLRTVYFEQGRTSLDPQLTLREALSPGGDTVLHRDRPLHVVAWAKQFLFREEQLGLVVGALSGGERARVRVAQLMLQPADVLLLDEPTNDLDIPALEVLEESLEEFPGAVVLVSHDREMMGRLCTEIIGFDGQGGAESFAALSQWLARLEQNAARPAAKSPTPKPDARPSRQAAKPSKLSFHEQKEWEQIERLISRAEVGLTESQAEVERSARLGHEALTAACHAMEEAQREVDRLYERWQTLEAKRAAFEAAAGSKSG